MIAAVLGIVCVLLSGMAYRYFRKAPSSAAEAIAKSLVIRPSSPTRIPRSILLFDDDRLTHQLWAYCAKRDQVSNLVHYECWEDFARREDLLEGSEIAFVDLNYRNSQFDGFQVAQKLRGLGLNRIYALTGDPAFALKSGVFDGVYGKDLPPKMNALWS